MIADISKNIHIRDYMSILRRRKWIFISFFVITVTAITLATFIQPEIYSATATVIIDVETPNVLSVQDVVKLGETNYFAYRDYIETQQEIIKGRRTAHYVMKNLKLAGLEEFRKAKDPIEALLKKMKVELIKDTRMLKIHAEDEDPQLAARLANEFAKVYAESNLTLKIKASSQAQEWLKGEVESQKQKLRRSELELQKYKEENDIISIENQKAMIEDSLSKLNASYLDAQEKRIHVETTYNSLIDKEGRIRSVNLPALLIDNESLQNLKNEYLKQDALLVEYQKVYKHKHPKMIKLLENIEHSRASIKREVETGYNTALEEEKKFEKALADHKKKSLQLEKKIINYNALEREVDTNEKMLQIVLNRLKETSIANQIQTNNVRVQDLAEVPKKSVRPKKELNIFLSVIIGLIGGISLAFFRDYMDVTVREPQEIARLLQLPILGSVPRVRPDRKNIRNKKDIDRVVEKDLHSLASEAYRTIRTNLLFSLNHSSSSKSIVVTSSIPREGKTLSAVNLATIIANSGERVLLVDADLRKPRVHTIFNEDAEPGLSQFLSGENNLDDIVRDTGINNLYLVTAGKASAKPAELLSSDKMRKFLEESSSAFSKIIFDTPPVTLVTDAQILSSICTGVILIAEGGRVTKDFLIRSKELLHKVDAKVVGIIMNSVRPTDSVYSYPKYYYGK